MQKFHKVLLTLLAQLGFPRGTLGKGTETNRNRQILISRNHVLGHAAPRMYLHEEDWRRNPHDSERSARRVARKHTGRPKRAGNSTVRKRDDSCPDGNGFGHVVGPKPERQRASDVARWHVRPRLFLTFWQSHAAVRLSKPAAYIEHAIFPREMRKCTLLSRLSPSPSR